MRTVDCVLRDRAALVRLEERLLHGKLGLAERALVHLPWEQARDAARVCAERHGVEEQLCKACLALDLGALERVERRELPEPALAPELDLVLQARMQREPVLVERRMQVGADLVDGVVQDLPELHLGDQPCVRAVLGERAVFEPLDRVAHHGVLPRHGRAPVRDARLVVRDVDQVVEPGLFVGGPVVRCVPGARRGPVFGRGPVGGGVVHAALAEQRLARHPLPVPLVEQALGGDPHGGADQGPAHVLEPEGADHQGADVVERLVPREGLHRREPNVRPVELGEQRLRVCAVHGAPPHVERGDAHDRHVQQL